MKKTIVNFEKSLHVELYSCQTLRVENQRIISNHPEQKVFLNKIQGKNIRCKHFKVMLNIRNGKIKSTPTLSTRPFILSLTPYRRAIQCVMAIMKPNAHALKHQ